MILTTIGMMNPTPQGQCTKSRSVAAVLLTLFFLGGCGMFSRQVQLQDALQEEGADLLTLRGREPLMPSTWMAATGLAETSQERLQILDRALTYLPGQPNFAITRIMILAESQQHQAVLDEARRFLSTQPPPEFESLTRQLSFSSLLAMGEIEAAYEQAQLLGSIEGLPQPMLSAALIVVALTQAEAGDEEKADATCDLALDRGEGAIPALVKTVQLSPERGTKARGLVERALARHPNNPDLYVYLTLDDIDRGDFVSASQHRQSIPPPLPPRLSPLVDLFDAQLAIHEDRPKEALSYLLPRLNQRPHDNNLLRLLVECWRKHETPPASEVLERLQLAQQADLPEHEAVFLATLVEEVASSL